MNFYFSNIPHHPPRPGWDGLSEKLAPRFPNEKIPWQVWYTVYIRFCTGPRGSSIFCMEKYLNHLASKISQIGLGRALCWVGAKSHKIQVGPNRLRKASTSTPIERPSGQIGFGRGPTWMLRDSHREGFGRDRVWKGANINFYRLL